MKVVVVDADVLGRQRTGDETYVLNLLRELGPLAPEAGFGLVAVTRHPELVPDGVEPIELPRALAGAPDGLDAAAAASRARRRARHTQHALPLRVPVPGVVTVHDLSFERDPGLMGRRTGCRSGSSSRAPCAAPRACSPSPSGRRRDLVELYGDAARADRRHAERRRSRLHARRRAARTYVLSVGAIQRAQEPARRARGRAGRRAAARRRRPGEGRRARARARARGATARGYVDDRASSPRSTAAPPASSVASRYEGFGLPVLEAMACGTPVVAVPEPALREVAGDAAVFVEEAELADGIRRALADRERLVAAGLERARAFTWRETAGARSPSTGRCSAVRVSAVVVSHGHAAELARSLPALAAAGRRARRRRQPARLGRGHPGTACA